MLLEKGQGITINSFPLHSKLFHNFIKKIEIQVNVTFGLEKIRFDF